MGKTLFEAPPLDPNKSQMENILELTPVAVIGPDVFTNTRPLWHPPGARGMYGGAVIAQSLSAAQLTVSEDFYPHSMHSYFLLAGDSDVPVMYHVERVRDGRSFATRTVQAQQRGKAIFTATMSFDKVVDEAKRKEKRKLEHASRKPGIQFPSENLEDLGLLGHAPLQCVRDVKITGEPTTYPADRSVYHFIRSRPQITAAGGPAAHLSAFAYMSDSSFIGTVAQVHNIPRFASIDALKSMLSQLKNPSDLEHEALEAYIRKVESAEAEKAKAKEAERLQQSANPAARREQEAKGSGKEQWELGMMVSLDHTIYFHTRHGFRADEWLLVEMYSPWAGEERGIALQNVWTRDGTLVATCVQEGIVRMKQEGMKSDEKKAKL
ncbi:Guanine nucleotide exchange factor lte1 [Ascosphaera pollenicola]|nr:Guanine nucleotide exchange factor lte1 [Ascosphaera pollenicola]